MGWQAVSFMSSSKKSLINIKAGMTEALIELNKLNKLKLIASHINSLKSCRNLMGGSVQKLTHFAWLWSFTQDTFIFLYSFHLQFEWLICETANRQTDTVFYKDRYVRMLAATVCTTSVLWISTISSLPYLILNGANARHFAKC